jgi:hypothetical protein
VTRALLLALVASTVGCGTLRTHRFQLGPAGPPGSRPAIVFEGSPIPSAVEEIAMVEAIGTGSKASQEDVLSALIDEGSRWGATVLVRVRVDCGYGTCHAYGVAARTIAR